MAVSRERPQDRQSLRATTLAFSQHGGGRRHDLSPRAPRTQSPSEDLAPRRESVTPRSSAPQTAGTLYLQQISFPSPMDLCVGHWEDR